MEAAIEVRDLRKSYGSHVALDGVDLTVAAGTVMGLLGANGAGKTTLVRILATLIAPDAGSAVVAGADVLATPAAVRGRIGLTGQYAAIDAQLTGRENLVLLGRLAHLRGRDARRRADALLEALGLAEAANRRCATYSGGMRRRLDLAASMVATPSVLFLDEPTTGLDPASRRDLWGIVRELVTGGTTILLTTQYLEEADELADQVAVLHDGRIATQGTAAQLKSRVGSQRLHIRPHDTTDLARAELILSDRSPQLDRGTRMLTVHIDGPGDVHRVLDDLATAAIPVADLDLSAPTLDDVFFAVLDTTRQEVPA